MSANPYLEELAAVTSPAATDILYIVRDPSSTPSDKKITYLNLSSLLVAADTAEAAARAAADVLLAPKASPTFTGTATSPVFLATTKVTTPLIEGGSASGDSLTLQSTSHSAKGQIKFGAGTDIYIDETTNELVVGPNGAIRINVDGFGAGDTAVPISLYTASFRPTFPAWYFDYGGGFYTQRWITQSGTQRTTGSQAIIAGFSESAMYTAWMDVDLGIGIRLSTSAEADQSYVLFKSCGDAGADTGLSSGGNYRFRIDGTSKIWWGDHATVAGLDTWLARISAGGGLETSGSFKIASASPFYIGTRIRISSPSTGALVLDDTGADFVKLSLGGVSSSFPCIGRSGSGLFFGLADGSNYTTVLANGFLAGDIPAFQAGANGVLQWSNAAYDPATTKDTGLARNAAGVVEVNNGTAGTLRDLKLRYLTVDGAGGGSQLKRILTATAALDFGSIAAGGSAELDVTVTGAVAGDGVRVSPNGSPESGLVWCGYAGTDKVTVRLDNTNLISATDPASRTWRVEVLQY